jgi:hypothetical protein
MWGVVLPVEPTVHRLPPFYFGFIIIIYFIMVKSHYDFGCAMIIITVLPLKK